MLAVLGDRHLIEVAVGPEDKEFEDVLPTTWRELLDDGLIDDEFSSFGSPAFRLTAPGWLRAMLVSGTADTGECRDRCTRLAQALRSSVKGRGSHYDELTTEHEVATAADLPVGWVFNAIKSRLLGVVFPKDRWDDTIDKKTIRVSPMELGSGRIIAQEAYRDVTRTFTGARVRWRPTGSGTLTAFAALPVLTLPDDRDSLLHNRIALDEEHFNQKLWGALYERDRLWLRSRGEIYVYSFREHDDPGKRETRDRKLWTIGGRLSRVAAAKVFDFDTEAAWQGGSAHASSGPSDVRSLDVAAHYVHLNGGYSFARSWSPRVGVEYDYGSADSNPADSRWNRFDSLFGNRRVDLAPTSIYGALGRENINTFGVRASIAPNARIDAFSVFRVVRLAAAADAFASTGVRDPTGRSGTDGGRHIDLRLRAWIIPASVRVEVGATHLINGHFLRVAPNATREGNSTFFYGDVTYTFGSK